MTTVSTIKSTSINGIVYTENEILSWIDRYNRAYAELVAIYTAKERLEAIENEEKAGRIGRLLYIAPRFQGNIKESLENLRISLWEKLLKTEDMRVFLTDKAYQKMKTRIEQAKDLEVTIENALTMLEALKQNNKETLLDTLVDLFDAYTSYHAEEFSKNKLGYNGWKTNNAFKLNEKIIFPNSVPYFTWKKEERYQSISWAIKEAIEDILKVFKLVSATPQGEWASWGDCAFENNILKFKVFKKGTIHVWFKDKEALSRLNFLVGQQKNWLPTENEIKNSKEAFAYIKKEFPNLAESLLIG